MGPCHSTIWVILEGQNRHSYFYFMQCTASLVILLNHVEWHKLRVPCLSSNLAIGWWSWSEVSNCGEIVNCSYLTPQLPHHELRPFLKIQNVLWALKMFSVEVGSIFLVMYTCCTLYRYSKFHIKSDSSINFERFCNFRLSSWRYNVIKVQESLQEQSRTSRGIFGL